MNIFNYLRNFFHNAYKLLKIASKAKVIYWDSLTNHITNCNIDGQAMVFQHHNLNNVEIGRGTYVAVHATISNTKIGKFCSIGPNLFCGWGIHPTNGISTSPVFYSIAKRCAISFSTTNKIEERKLITIGNDVFIGMNVTILDGVSIGDGAVIGAGAVVSKNIPPYAVAVGCPIKIIKFRFPQDKINALIESKWWDQDDSVLKEVEKNFFDVDQFLEVIKKG